MPPKAPKNSLKPRKTTSKSKSLLPAPDTRSTLLDAAQRHFSESGFKASSVHDIARDAGVNVSLISYHFGGKEGLFKSCIERAGVDRLQMTERILSTEPTSLSEVRIRLTMFIDEMLIDGIKNPEVCAIMHQGLHSDFPLIEDVFKKTFFRVFQLLTKFLETARDRGILASWLQPEMSAAHIMGAVAHTLRTDQLRKKFYDKSVSEPASRESTRDYLVKTYLEGLSHQPPPTG
jgi:AcrR family transcriptional regulator